MPDTFIFDCKAFKIIENCKNIESLTLFESALNITSRIIPSSYFYNPPMNMIFLQIKNLTINCVNINYVFFRLIFNILGNNLEVLSISSKFDTELAKLLRIFIKGQVFHFHLEKLKNLKQLSLAADIKDPHP